MDKDLQDLNKEIPMLDRPSRTGQYRQEYMNTLRDVCKIGVDWDRCIYIYSGLHGVTCGKVMPNIKEFCEERLAKSIAHDRGEITLHGTDYNKYYTKARKVNCKGRIL